MGSFIWTNLCCYIAGTTIMIGEVYDHDTGEATAYFDNSSIGLFPNVLKAKQAVEQKFCTIIKTSEET